ncbi:Uncharacterised protein [Mycobacteroides abscessus]|nr:Uncharacterised protein [Mycobacteroides abscessus]
MWGVREMKLAGCGSAPVVSRWCQNSRDTSNCSLIFTALVMSIVPSAFSGV